MLNTYLLRDIASLEASSSKCLWLIITSHKPAPPRNDGLALISTIRLTINYTRVLLFSFLYISLYKTEQWESFTRLSRSGRSFDVLTEVSANCDDPRL
jgi:hypothetical protein